RASPAQVEQSQHELAIINFEGTRSGRRPDGARASSACAMPTLTSGPKSPMLKRGGRDAHFREMLQATTSEANLLVLFIPSADREGDALGKKEQKRWVRKALKLLGEKFTGATAFPRGWGTWRDDAQGGRLVWDKPVLVQCFTDEAALERHAGPITDFLLTMGRQTNQGASAS